ncbi:MAG: hypothetical protein LBS47_01455 [Endomicrobium sp.]|jgi:hypothetical protein|nr:hypothetical protein [Endomicrobium sp.]
MNGINDIKDYIASGYTEFTTEKQIEEYMADFGEEIDDLKEYAYEKFCIEDYKVYNNSVDGKNLTLEGCKEKILNSQELIKKYVEKEEAGLKKKY